MQHGNRNADVELGSLSASKTPSTVPQKPSLPGYPSFANFIAEDADAAIYRKYERLSARNLLYLQSELHELEGDLEDLDARDFEEREVNDSEAQQIARYWKSYSRSGSKRAVERRELQGRIRRTIKEYRMHRVPLMKT